MRIVRVVAPVAVAVVVALAALVLGTGCTARPGAPGVGIENVVNNGDGTYTFIFTDGSSFTTDNLMGSQGVQGIQGVQGPAGQYPTPPASEVLYDNETVSIDDGQEIRLPMELKEGDRISVLLTAGTASYSLSARLLESDQSRVLLVGDVYHKFGEVNPMQYDWIVPADDTYTIVLLNHTGSTQTVTVYAKRYPSIRMWAE